MREFINRYFGLILLAAMAAAAIAGGVIRHSFVSAALWALAALGAAIVFFVLLGPIAAGADARNTLRSEAAAKGWTLTLLRAWAIGLIAWIPPNPVRTQFLATWALIFVGIFFWVLPWLPAWPTETRALAVAGFVIVAGVINGAFHASCR